MNKLAFTVLSIFVILSAGVFVLDASGEPPEDSAMHDRAGKPGEAELRSRLTPIQFEVTQNEGTEPPYKNPFWDHEGHGVYVDVVSGDPLFSSLDKFDAGCGWPSFTRPIDEEVLVRNPDYKMLVPRVEVRSTGADSHLGHVFEDGPAPTGLRYCINSAALRFVPVDQLEAEGMGKYLPRFAEAGVDIGQAPAVGQSASPAASSARREEALLAGGCFWGMEEIIREIDGVIDTEVGYTGGTVASPDYRVVSTGRSGHAESIQVVFDPEVLDYSDLIRWFFRMHDPTTLNRQGGDRGSQYRSAIFVLSDEQRLAAEKVVAEVNASGRYKAPIVTEITDAGPFYEAEEHHQDYLQKNPSGYTCHYVRD